MTFSFRPRRSSFLPMIAASVSTRVVSWNEAAEMNESVDSDALVIPSSMWLVRRPAVLPSASTFSFSSSTSARSTCSPVMNRVSPASSIVHAAQHLPHDHLDVLVVDLHALQPVDVLHLVGDVARERLDPLQPQDVVRIGRTVDDHLALVHHLAVVDGDVLVLRDQELVRHRRRGR